jgi:hypothetical protein
MDGQSVIGWAWRSVAKATTLWGGTSRGDGAVREAVTTYGAKPPVEAEPRCGIGCIRFGQVWLDNSV